MSKSALTHAQNRAKVCLLCFQKGSSMSLITGITLTRVQSYFFENFNPLDQKLPNGICGLCRLLLHRVELSESDPKKSK